MISGIIKVEVSVIIEPKPKAEADNTKVTNRDLDYFGYHKNQSNNCFTGIIHCFKEDNEKRIIAPNTVSFQ